MTTEEQRISIAEACGWSKNGSSGNEEWPWVKPVNGVAKLLPDYPNDLNAMHEAEKVLDMHQQYDYGEALARMTIGAELDDPEGFSPNGWGYYSPTTATAAQRAEAFLKTLNLWTK